MSKQIIIIIPTHNRQAYIKYVVKYYSLFPCKVYICDSSKQKADVVNTGNVIYRWIPDTNFYDKILQILDETTADYYALSPDDDYLKEETLLECFNALSNNDVYSLGIGKQILFREKVYNQFYSFKGANQLEHIANFEFKNSNDYINYFWKNYQNILWSVFRKDVLDNAFKCLSKCNFDNGNFIELILGIESLRAGHVYASNNGLNYREVIDGEHWGNTTPSISYKNIEKYHELYNDVQKFKSYYQCDNQFALYSLNSYLNAEIRSVPFISKMMKYVPLSIKNYIKRSFKRNNNIPSKSDPFVDIDMSKKISLARKN